MRDRVEAETSKEDKRTRKAREKRDVKAAEGMRAWAEARSKAEIATIAVEASERAMIEAEVRSR